MNLKRVDSLYLPFLLIINVFRSEVLVALSF